MCMRVMLIGCSILPIGVCVCVCLDPSPVTDWDLLRMCSISCLLTAGNRNQPHCDCMDLLAKQDGLMDNLLFLVWDVNMAYHRGYFFLATEQAPYLPWHHGQ